MKRLAIALIRFYRKYISGLKKQPTCRFTPTCSQYALEAFEKRGFFVGFILTVARIVRCQPLSVGGYDPVPETGLRNPKHNPQPITKYYYPEEYGIERTDNDNPDVARETENGDNSQ